ncbi:MAG: CTP synthetase [Candidatus Diapherotrites archaeon CG08_land_8_20_14_0_20_30_16]|nr:MAG: CTP synthetase [Candidatus Diapherotrites archaeon CG08_land_8_20_14_0_20_30_16]
MKYIVVTGGVVSGIGKGVASASIAKLIQTNYDLKVMPIKCDGYLNVDPGTMNPIEHGEVFVMDDGGEVDMDFGHYERFLNITTKFSWNLTMGKILSSIIEKERKGLFLGKTTQFIPHVTNEILENFIRLPEKENCDVCVIEIGGTIGDLENAFYVEAVRQLQMKFGKDNVIFVHLTYVPMLSNVGEQKSKPTQQSVHLLMEQGIFPDFILGRAKDPLSSAIKEKIGMYSNLDEDNIISAPDVSNIYDIPLNFAKEKLDKKIGTKLKLLGYKNRMNLWADLLHKMKNSKTKKKILIAGKYTALHDSYASVIEAIKHASAHLSIKPEIVWLDTSYLTYEQAKTKLKDIDAIIVPGGFGSRGTEGKINVIKYARENNIPYLGLCFGLQLATIEYARTVCGLKDANSTEINTETTNPIIDILPEQKDVDKKGHTMRLGSQLANLKPNSLTSKLYNSHNASERHRHRYEVNPDYHKILEDKGLILSGLSPNGRLVEYIELPKEKHKYFIATQAHPELKSKFEEPNPLFFGLLKATLE